MFDVRFYLDGHLRCIKSVPSLPDINDTVRFSDTLQGIVNDRVWNLNVISSAGESVDIHAVETFN